MDKRTINQIIKFLKQSLNESGLNVDSIAIFGSAMTGKMHAESDLDLIIISKDFANKDIFERSKMTIKTEIDTYKKFKAPMDILNLTPEEYNIKMLFPSKIV